MLSFLLVLLSFNHLQAANEACIGLFSKSFDSTIAVRQLPNEEGATNVAAALIFDRLREDIPAFRSKELETINSSIEIVLGTEELSVLHENVWGVAKALEKNYRQGHLSSKTTPQKLIGIFKDSLEGRLSWWMSEKRAKERIALLVENDISRAAALRAFGFMTLKEVQVAYKELLREYLNRSEEKLGSRPAVAKFRFMTGPAGESPRPRRGVEKTYVSVGARTVPLVQELIGNNPHFLIHEHEPGQGTLQMYHWGQSVSYAQYEQHRGLGYAWGSRQFVDNIIAPVILLSTSEASRVKNYFDLGRISNRARSKYPSSFRDTYGSVYVRPGGNVCCTHWIGEMPFGDEFTTRYAFPGQMGSHGGPVDPQSEKQSDLRIGPIGTYTYFIKPDGTRTEVGDQSLEDRLTRMVWKENRGPQQLWQVLGLRANLQRAELTNPGWTLYNFLSRAPNDRIPVVFVWRRNTTKPLSDDELESLRETISPR